MKGLTKLFFAVTFLALATCLNSSASSLLCQSGPVTLTGNLSLVTIYSCAIPANAVASGQSIRVTAALGSGGSMLSDLILNGYELTDANPPSGVSQWEFEVLNTGSNTGSLGGLMPGASAYTVKPFGYQNVPVSLPWSSGWTLQIAVWADSGVKELGFGFTVEVLN